jgi:hypothetical protein
VVLRVSDIFNKVPNPFVMGFDATSDGKGGRVLLVNKRNIAWVTPEDTLPPPHP